MKVSYLYWNARGLGTSRERLKNLVTKFHPKLVVIAKPMVSISRLDMWRDRLHFDGCCSNVEEGGKLWLFWSQDLHLVVENMGDQFLTVRITNLNDFSITFVYAKCSYLERRRLWDSLMGANIHHLPWMVMGDFNIIRNDSERRGGRPRLALAMEEFNNWVGSCGLLNMPSCGNSLSWCNGHSGRSRHWARLDRCLFNTVAFDAFPGANMEYLFFDCVSHSWNGDDVGGSHLYMLVTKLKHLKIALRTWNNHTFGKTVSHVAALEDRIKGLEVSLQTEYAEDMEDDLVASQLELSVWLNREEQCLAQQAKQHWIQKGEANSAFFCAVSRRNHKEVKAMQLEDGSILSSTEQIHDRAITYFSNFLKVGNSRDEPNLGDLVQPINSQDENDLLFCVPLSQEVYDALCSIPEDSSPGPDGFGSGFYRSCWHIVGTDVVAAVSEFFQGMALPRFFNATHLVLIPKLENPTSFDKFRLISLCDVFYKICTKIMVNRLSPLLANFISPEQGAFLSGCSIFDNISMTQEMIHSINKPVYGGNVVLKIDMAKAFSSVDWSFLLQVPKAFGFSDFFCKLIRQCITNPWFSVVMKGVPKGFFKGGRGLRQGDPISPYLFILVEDIFSRMINNQIHMSKIIPFHHPQGSPIISHLLYADDTVLFCNGGKASLKAITDVLKTYEQWSGQAVNKNKSHIFFSTQISASRHRALLRFTGFTEGSFPFKYLGVPIITGRLKIPHFDDLIAKVQSKLEGWQARLLSSGAHLTLIKHVLQSILVHSLSILKTPKAVIEKIHRIISTFFWGVKDGKPKKKWCSWVDICKPVSEGGLGLRNLQDVQSSLHMKLAWNLLQGTSLWSKFFHTKYIGDRHISMVDHKKGSLFWKMILNSISLVQANSKWKVREGNVLFWHDHWADDAPLCDNILISDMPNLKLEDCKAGLGCNMDLFTRLVGHHKAEDLILQLGRIKKGKDLLIWLPSADGLFSTKSAWNCIRIRAPVFPWANWVWHSALPNNISITMWKAIHNCLPVDGRIRNLGISIVSCCDCCSNSKYEDLNHCLAIGDFAKKIWRICSIVLGIPWIEGSSWKQRVECWYRRAKNSNRPGQLLGLLPTIITWRLWRRRCKARMEGLMESVQQVWCSIKYWVSWIGLKLKDVNVLSRHDEGVLHCFNMPLNVTRKEFIIPVKWKLPKPGWVKLNVDSSSLGNPGPSGAGGIIRDDNSNFLCGFAAATWHNSNNYAELMGLLHGLRHIGLLGVSSVEIET
ncbi:uncharacterized protein LOC122312726 [Carya illinoinensis]|uniref:uncharacterized protein LOC122312726 n=1 Tax=Carya illinoinensis TaxID=32201 RepID=UPI001C720627|nr:uncharacterized protein LOC122312726 [Carya illinoinensis]